MKIQSLLWFTLVNCLAIPSFAQLTDARAPLKPIKESTANADLADAQQQAELAAKAEERAKNAKAEAEDKAKAEAAARRQAAVAQAPVEVEVKRAVAAEAALADFDGDFVADWVQAEQPVAARTKNHARRFDLTIADMKRVCELSDQQMQKLQLASKGAIARLTEKNQDPQQKPQAGVELRAFGADAALNVNGRFVTVFSANQVNPLDGKFWKAAVAKVLTDEQKKKYQETVANREKQTQDAIVDLAIAKLDQDLLLSEQQKNDIRTKIVEKQKTPPQEGRVFRVIGHDSSGLGEEDLKTILTEPQLAEWKSKHQPQQVDFAPVFVAPARQILVKPKP